MIALPRLRLFALGCLGLLALAGGVSAQPGVFGRPIANPYQQPTISPYLNLLRPGDAAANYFLLVRPEFQQRALNAQNSAAIQDLERRSLAVPGTTADELLPTLPSTGHAASFMNHGGYFGATSAVRPGASPGNAALTNRGRR